MVVLFQCMSMRRIGGTIIAAVILIALEKMKVLDQMKAQIS